MIEYSVIDYEGELVIIEDGEIYMAEPPQVPIKIYYDRYGDESDIEYGDAVWNSQTCDWEEYDPAEIPYEAPYHGLSRWECNTDFRNW